MNNYLINSDSGVSGIYRAKLIQNQNSEDIRAYIPGIHSTNPFDESGNLKSDVNIEMFPKIMWCSYNIESTQLSNQSGPAWVMFENGDFKRPVVVSYTVIGGSGFGSGSSGGNTSFISITGFSDILLVAGHGNGDPGASGNGYKESDLTREVVNLLSQKLKCDVYDTSRNLKDDVDNNNTVVNLKDYKVVMNIHFNSGDSTANGTEILVKDTSQPTNIEKAVLDAIVKVGFTNRGFKDANDLHIMKHAIATGVQNCFYVEVCFISSSSDMQLYELKKNEIVDNIVEAFNSIIESSKLGGTGIGSVNENTMIMGTCVATYNQMIAFLQEKNSSAPDYIKLYISEGAAEGVRGDIAFAQSCVETGYWTFTGDVSADQNNFAGLGATGNGEKGESFESPQLGIRAQIQHLKAYASTENLNGTCVDNRFTLVTRGSATTIGSLGSGAWAKDSVYSTKIINILNEILSKPI